jgi:integrase
MSTEGTPKNEDGAGVAFNAGNVKRLRPRPGRDRDVLWDTTESSPPQFAMRVRQTGRGTYLISYRNCHGVRRTMAIGRVGKIALADARTAATEILKAVARREDPAVARRGKTGEPFGKLVEEYIGSEPRAKKTQYTYKNALKIHILPSALGKKQPSEITSKDIKGFLDAKERKAGPVAADRLHALVRAALRWALRKGKVAADPTAALDRRIKLTERERVLTETEVAALWRGCEKALTAKWVDIDWTASEWRLPGTSRKGGEPHVIPLSPQAKAALEPLRFKRSRGLIFGGLGSNQSRFMSVVYEVVPVKEWHAHDLRRTAATGCARIGAGEDVIRRILGHAESRRGATRIYQRFNRLPEVAKALTAWGEHIDGLLLGNAKANLG